MSSRGYSYMWCKVYSQCESVKYLIEFGTHSHVLRFANLVRKIHSFGFGIWAYHIVYWHFLQIQGYIFR